LKTIQGETENGEESTTKREKRKGRNIGIEGDNRLPVVAEAAVMTTKTVQAARAQGIKSIPKERRKGTIKRRKLRKKVRMMTRYQLSGSMEF
jgi:hypothetical protein